MPSGTTEDTGRAARDPAPRTRSHRPGAAMPTVVRPSSFLSAGLAVVALAGAGLAATAGAAHAQAGGAPPFIQHWSAFSGGTVGGYTLGDVIELHYVEPRGPTPQPPFLWSPAPDARP